MKEGYLPKEERKKIMFLCDDIRMHSGIATMAREIVLGTAHIFNWVNVGAAVNHPEVGKKIDLSQDSGNRLNIPDASVFLYPQNGYGNPDIVRQLLKIEKPDAIFFFTDPRYWEWLFKMENEIRTKVPMVYLNIWDDLPAPMYNESFYESCDTLLAISKQTENINKIVLGDKAKDKIIKYVPHGINENVFKPITEGSEHWNSLLETKKRIFNGKEYDHIFFFNSRNIRRKCISDLFAAFKVFKDQLSEEEKDKVALLLHTQPIDDNGTDLFAVRDMLLGEDPNILFSTERISAESMNLLYNIADVTVLPSSNEGWGLALTESMMAGTMIIANVTGGMQDQMRFEDENGNWIEFDENFCSNHFGTYKKHGKWAIPVFPSNSSIVGSPKTPYIFDDRLDFRDLAKALMQSYKMTKKEKIERGLAGRKWVTSDESMASSRKMNENIIKYLSQTINNFKPRKNFEFIKIKKLPVKQLQHKLIY
ncbi:glycosyltransferase [bacterium]|nr:glycosyltransferase [bacterium]